jgi:mannitol-specific phosphotransferase system IIBC component
MVVRMVVKHAADVRLVVFACEAGMGSSLIGANQLKKRLSKLGRDIRVIHSPVNQIPAETDVVVAHEGLAERARKAAPAAVVLTFKSFMNNEGSDRLVKSLEAGEDITSDAGSTR